MTTKLFTKEFLDKLQKKYSKGHKRNLLDSLMDVHGLSFHDAIVTLAKWKKMKPEYYERPNSEEVASNISV
jgi:hypothetical protein